MSWISASSSRFAVVIGMLCRNRAPVFLLLRGICKVGLTSGGVRLLDGFLRVLSGVKGIILPLSTDVDVEFVPVSLISFEN